MAFLMTSLFVIFCDLDLPLAVKRLSRKDPPQISPFAGICGVLLHDEFPVALHLLLSFQFF
jgi:hypothetical protein